MEKKVKLSYFHFLKQYQKNYHRFFAKMLADCGEVFSFKVLSLKIHIVLNPTYIKYILQDNRKNYIKIPILVKVLDSLIGPGSILTLNDFDEWQRDRNVVNPLFSENQIKKYISNMVAATSKCLDEWEEFRVENKPMNIDQAFSKITLTSLLENIFGGISIDHKRISYFIRKIMYLISSEGKLFGIIPLALYTKRKFKRELNELGDEIIEKCLNESANDNFIKALSKTYDQQPSKNNPQDQLRATALIILAAGHETTAASLCWTFYYLSVYPLIFDKVCEEVQKVLGQRPPTYDDLVNLKYTRAVIQESLRLQPPLINFLRYALADDNIGAYKIKKGDNFLIDIYHLHRLPAYWENPEGFDPTRFLEPLGSNYDYVYIPFGAGPRSCLGKYFSMTESIIILAMVAQRFRLTLTTDSPTTPEPTTVNKPDSRMTMMVEKIKGKI